MSVVEWWIVVRRGNIMWLPIRGRGYSCRLSVFVRNSHHVATRSSAYNSHGVNSI